MWEIVWKILIGKLIQKKQKIIALRKGCEGDHNVVSMNLVGFNRERTLTVIAKMISTDELPFKFVQNEGFRKVMEEAQPYFKIPSRMTLLDIAC